MAKFESRFKELGFYVDDKLHKFSNGSFSTEDKKVIEVLEGLKNVKRVDEPKKETKPEPKEETKKQAPKKSQPKASKK